MNPKPNPTPDLHQRITNWHVSSYSGTGADCIEYGSLADLVAFRDSKQKMVPDHDRPVLVFSPQAAVSFLNAVKSGQFPRPS